MVAKRNAFKSGFYVLLELFWLGEAMRVRALSAKSKYEDMS